MWFTTFIVLVCVKLTYLLYPVEVLLFKRVASKNYMRYLYQILTMVGTTYSATNSLFCTFCPPLGMLFVMFVLYRSMYCLCVNVYCTSATG
jgi:hypothetical protein